MNKSQKIEKFIMEAFDIYSLDYKEFFNYQEDNFFDIFDIGDFNITDEDFAIDDLCSEIENLMVNPDESFSLDIDENNFETKPIEKLEYPQDEPLVNDEFGVAPANPFIINDGYVCETHELPQVIERSLVYPLIKRAAKILGVPVKTLVDMDKEAIRAMYKKYPYFSYKEEFEESRIRAAIHEDDISQRFLLAIFGHRMKPFEVTRYSKTAVLKRLEELLKEYDVQMPGAYHKNASLKGNVLFCNFFHYEEIKDAVDAYLEMVNRAKALFEKAWDGDLNADEIREYNFLACVLGIQDILVQKKERPCYTIEDAAFKQDFLFYDILKQLIPLYKEQESSREFLSIVKFKNAHKFMPWMCIEFLADRDLVQKYTDIFPETKHEMRDFAMRASKFLCLYSWSDEDDGGEYLHKAYVPKTPEEQAGEEDAIKNINILSGPVKKGGIKTKFNPVKVLNRTLGECMFSRTQAMLSVKGDSND